MKNPLCPYKHLFGEPGKGVHSYRFMNFAIMDVLMTLIGAILFSYFTKYTLWKVIIAFFLIGIVAHRLFCVRTTVDKILFP